MKEPYSDGVANQAGPKPWAFSRKAVRQASVGVCAGKAIEPRKYRHGSADAVQVGGKQHHQPCYRKRRVDSPRSKNLCMYTTTLRENRESLTSIRGWHRGYVGKSKDVIP